MEGAMIWTVKERILRDLFRFQKPETRGESLHVRLIELLMVAQILWHAWKWAFYLPMLSEVLSPTGLANYLDLSFFFRPEVAFLNAFLISVAGLAGFLRRGKWYYLIVLILFHLQYAARFSQGAIGHGTNLTGMVLLSFVLSDLFFRPGTERRRTALGFILFFAGLGYVSAGVSKLVGTGLIWPDGGHLYLWMGERSIDKLSQQGTFQFNPIQEFLFEHYWAATLLLLGGLLSELLGFLLWFRRTRAFQATLLIGMHLGILWIMNINFGPYILILLMIGYPWGDWIDRALMGFLAGRFEPGQERSGSSRSSGSSGS